MCGIAGIIEKRSHQSGDSRSRLEADLGKMNNAQKHRGPDGEGVFTELARGSLFGFGHRRLAILDLSPAGHQPMIVTTRQGARLVLTYNGEIYNYVELKAELKEKGYRFQSETDSEVLIRSYEEWGEACLEKFNGMFAFAIFDEKRQAIFAARDRFGVKPFYYRDTGDRFQFASEIKAVLSLGRSSGVDHQTVVDYLFSGHLGFSERTFFRDVKELRPGHWLRFDLGSGTWTTGQWYDLASRVDAIEISFSEKEATHEVQRLLTDAVRVRLRSDVPVGTCLSGGIDSSSIASIAADLNASQSLGGTRSPQKSSFIGITASSLDPQNDETEFARLVAESRGLNWNLVRPQSFIEKLEEVVRLQDEPFGGLSVFMQEAVMAKAKELGVPVLLDGQGGDEVFLGYPKYLQGFLGFRPRLFAKRLASQMGILERRELETELARSFPKELKAAKEHLLTYRRSLSVPRKAQIMDLTCTNLPQLLRYEDRNSMHHSIETRLPFLDYRLVELGVALPAAFKIDSQGTQKAILRKAMRGVVPDRILDRQDKVGFAPPDRVWSREFAQLWRDSVSESGFLNRVLGEAALRQELAEKTYSQELRWKLINLAIWSKSYFI